MFNVGEARGPGIVPVSDCVVASKGIGKLISELKPLLGNHVEQPADRGVTITEDGTGACFSVDRPRLHFAGGEGIGRRRGCPEGKNGREVLGKHGYLASGQWSGGPENSNEVTQANGEVTQLLVKDLLAMGEASPEHILELFCGSGTLTIPLLTSSMASWTGVDAAEAAVMTLRETLVAQDNLSLFVASDPSEVPPRAGKGATLCLMDPPREGAADWLDWMESKGDLETILYVSCDHDAGERRGFPGRARIRNRHLYGYDMFPNTGHRNPGGPGERRKENMNALNVT